LNKTAIRFKHYYLFWMHLGLCDFKAALVSTYCALLFTKT